MEKVYEKARARERKKKPRVERFDNEDQLDDPYGEKAAANSSDANKKNGHYHPEGVPRRTLTDLGNAERFVDDHGSQVRWCSSWGKWLVWDSKRWLPDDTGEVERMMKETIRKIYAEATEAESEQERKAIADHAKRSESKRRITDALHLARSEPGIPILPERLDADPWLFNVSNGTIDLRSGQLREHRREDLLTKIAPVEFDSDAEAPRFEAFLEEILPSEALRCFVQRMIGYALNGTTREHKLAVLHGRGSNGKSTLVAIVLEAFGDYGLQAADDLLMVKRGAHPTERADLFGRRFVANVETERDCRLSEALVKHLTGGDRIRARRMREDFWEFDPTHTLFLATNHKPVIRGTDPAIWRRIKLVPFGVTIPDERQDTALLEKLREELPGVLAWAVKGHAAWLSDGLGEPEEVRAATEGYRAELDTLAAFIEERCVTGPNVRAKATPLYQSYRAWCEESGERFETQTSFGLLLGERGFERKKIRGAIWWGGIALREDEGPRRGDSSSEGDRWGPEFNIDKNILPHEASMLEKGPQLSPPSPTVPHEDREERVDPVADDPTSNHDRPIEERRAGLERCAGEPGCLCDQCVPV